MLPYPTVRATMNKIVLYVAVPILGHAQLLFLTAIAANRFTAFAFPLKHAAIWRTRTVVVTIILLTVMSIFLGAAYPVAVAIHQSFVCSWPKNQDWEFLCQYDIWAFEQVRFDMLAPSVPVMWYIYKNRGNKTFFRRIHPRN